MVALKQQLEEVNKLKDLAKKAKLQAEEDKVKPRRRGMRLSNMATTSA